MPSNYGAGRLTDSGKYYYPINYLLHDLTCQYIEIS